MEITITPSNSTDTEKSDDVAIIGSSFDWLSTITSPFIISGIALFSIFGLNPEGYEQKHHETYTIAESPNQPSQSLASYQIIVLPPRFGKHFSNVENDMALINYYRNAKFFDERDFLS
jgi:hypothetical protein